MPSAAKRTAEDNPERGHDGRQARRLRRGCEAAGYSDLALDDPAGRAGCKRPQYRVCRGMIGLYPIAAGAYAAVAGAHKGAIGFDKWLSPGKRAERRILEI